MFSKTVFCVCLCAIIIGCSRQQADVDWSAATFLQNVKQLNKLHYWFAEKLGDGQMKFQVKYRGAVSFERPRLGFDQGDSPYTWHVIEGWDGQNPSQVATISLEPIAGAKKFVAELEQPVTFWVDVPMAEYGPLIYPLFAEVTVGE
jgi:hypothetical protein